MKKSESLQVTVTGAGRHTVVLSHGFGSDQSAWTAVREALNPYYRVVSYNLAGAGRNGGSSYDPEAHNSVFGYVDDLLAILEEQCPDRVIYIGHSFSCMIGIVAAVARPQCFERLILLQASPRYLNDEGYIGGFEQHQLDAIYEAMHVNFHSWAAGFVPQLLGVEDEHVLAKFSSTLFLMRPDIALTQLRMIFQSDKRDMLKRVRTPVHLIHSRSDLAVPIETAHWLQQQLVGSEAEILDLDGHLPHITDPDQVVAALLRHLPAP